MNYFINIFTNQYVITLVFLTFAGFLIRSALVISGQKWANTYHHLATCLMLPGVGFIITSVIKDDIALSLGMIGALSIVRFRNPVKSPFELVIFFALLTLGVVSSTGLKLSFLLLALVLSIILGIDLINSVLKKFGYSLFQFSFNDGQSAHVLEITSSKLLNEIQSSKNINYFYYDKESNHYNFRLVFKSKEDLLIFKKKIIEEPSILNIRADMQT